MAGILTIQLQSTLGKKDVNLNKIDYYVNKNIDKKLDLVVMPEFFSTGIDRNSFLNAPENENGGETIAKIQELAKKYNTNIVAGSVIEKSDNKLYNTSFIINRSGEILSKYRKIHLYNYMGGTEGERITPGDQFCVVELDFAKIGLGICFDIRYPLHFKTLAKMGADIIVLPTAYCVPNDVYNNKNSKHLAQEMWIMMNRVRAYDNFTYLVTSNQTKKSNDNVSCIGNSMIIAPNGEILANAKDEQTAVFANIDLEMVKYYRAIYPIATID